MPQQNSTKIVRQEKISNQVYEQLLAQIKSNKWKEGAKLPSENEMRQEFGVSRISIREAMQKLKALGIVETRHGEGSFIRRVTSENYRDMLFPMFMIDKNSLQEILEYRMVMEVGATEIAAMRITKEECDALEAIVVRMEQNATDIKVFAHDDIQFHMAIAKATKNNMLINVALFMQDLMNASMESIVTHLGMHDGRYYHRVILEALRVHNREEAARLMREHVAKTVDRISELAEL